MLFLGNSHTARNDVPGTVAALVESAEPGLDVEAVLGPGSLHLDEREGDEASLASVSGRSWDFVVLQAQNYSLSGTYDFPTDGAEELIRLARQGGAEPVLFAEWARVGIDETGIILDAYRRVTDREPACLPPVPEAFDLALARDPDLVLHAADGNHSSPAGAFLASAVLAAAVSGERATSFSTLTTVDVPADVQAELRQVAEDAMTELPADRVC